MNEVDVNKDKLCQGSMQTKWNYCQSSEDFEINHKSIYEICAPSILENTFRGTTVQLYFKMGFYCKDIPAHNHINEKTVWNFPSVQKELKTGEGCQQG